MFAKILRRRGGGGVSQSQRSGYNMIIYCLIDLRATATRYTQRNRGGAINRNELVEKSHVACTLITDCVYHVWSDY